MKRIVNDCRDPPRGPDWTLGLFGSFAINHLSLSLIMSQTPLVFVTIQGTKGLRDPRNGLFRYVNVTKFYIADHEVVTFF